MPETRRRIAPSLTISESRLIEFAADVRGDRSASDTTRTGALGLARTIFGTPPAHPSDDDRRVAPALERVAAAQGKAAELLEADTTPKALTKAAEDLRTALADLERVRGAVQTERQAAKQRAFDEGFPAQVRRGVEWLAGFLGWQQDFDAFLTEHDVDRGTRADLAVPLADALSDYRSRLERALLPRPHVNGRQCVVRLEVPADRRFSPRERKAKGAAERALAAAGIDLSRYRVGVPEAWLTPEELKLAQPLLDLGFLRIEQPPAAAPAVSSQPPVLVKLLRAVPPNNVGEVIGVPLETAQLYLDKGIATYAGPLVAPAPAAEARVRVRVRAAFDRYSKGDIVHLPLSEVARLDARYAEALDGDVTIAPAPKAPPPAVVFDWRGYQVPRGAHATEVIVRRQFGLWSPGERVFFGDDALSFLLGNEWVEVVVQPASPASSEGEAP